MVRRRPRLNRHAKKLRTGHFGKKSAASNQNAHKRRKIDQHKYEVYKHEKA